jgi:diguanylate cyclase (GGDEF)-like protein
LLWRAFSARRTWWISWLGTELHNNYAPYICLALGAVGVFALLGYIIGARHDEFREVSAYVQDSNAELTQLASTDPLTGLFNAREMHARLDLELENSGRRGLACLLIDIDHFKKINDTYGHPFGDEVLVSVANGLKRTVRRVDAVGRLGGEEFLIILCGVPEARAREVAERARQAVQAEPLSFNGKSVRATICVGMAFYSRDMFPDKMSLLKAADDALYRAKKTGRNRVVVWAPNASA